VCGLTGTPDERLWHLGSTVRANLSAIAAVEVSVSQVKAAGLTCESAPEENYDEHGVILGWDDDPDAKDKRLAAQQELVANLRADSVRRPIPANQ